MTTALTNNIKEVVIPEINSKLAENPDKALIKLPKYEYLGWRDLAVECLRKILVEHQYSVNVNKEDPDLLLILKQNF